MQPNDKTPRSRLMWCLGGAVMLGLALVGSPIIGYATRARERDAGDTAVPWQRPSARPVTLQTLSDFSYYPAGSGRSGSPRDSVPPSIRELSGKKIVVEGFMLPADFTEGTCTRFVLASAVPGCCFGCSMRPNNWIGVTMAGEKAASYPGSAGLVRVEGTLEVSGKEEDPADVPLYTMTADAVENVR